MTTRRLATVLFTDIVGSTDRLAELGDAGWGELLDRHRRMVRAQIEHFGGREVTTTGDGFLVLFDEPGPAIRSAMAIRDAARPLGIAVRTGVHTAEIEHTDEGDVGGIAVHLASRVTDVAEPGEILTTGTVKELVQGAGFRFSARGVRKLAGMPDRWPLFAVAVKAAGPATKRTARSRARWSKAVVPGALALVIVAALTFLLLRDRGASVSEGEEKPVTTAVGTTSTSERSIAVLPLENLSPDPDDAYFAGAMTEEITSALSKVPGLQVVSRTSAARFAGWDGTTPEIAEQLGVRYVLEGSVRRAGDEIAIVVQLIDAARDQHVWTQRYERVMEDVIGLQVEIARRIADELRSSFTEEEKERILAGSTDDPVAYDLYLKALALSGPGGVRDAQRSIELLRSAVERDPGFPQAWMVLSFLYRLVAVGGDSALADSSLAAIDRAIELAGDPTLELTYRAYRAVLRGEDRQAAITAIREALQANPNDPVLVTDLSVHYIHTGELVDAIRWGRRAVALNPLDATRWVMLCDAYRILGMETEADRAIRRAIDLDPNNNGVWVIVNRLRLQQGRYDEALAALDSLEALGSPFAPLGRARVYLWAGDVERARRLLEGALDEMPREEFWSSTPELVHLRLLSGDSVGIADLLRRAEEVAGRFPRLHPQVAYVPVKLAAVAGDTAAAIDKLRAYVEQGGREARVIGLDPTLERVRSAPGFQSELRTLEQQLERMKRTVQQELEQSDGVP